MQQCGEQEYTWEVFKGMKTKQSESFVQQVVTDSVIEIAIAYSDSDSYRDSDSAITLSR